MNKVFDLWLLTRVVYMYVLDIMNEKKNSLAFNLNINKKNMACKLEICIMNDLRMPIVIVN